MNMHNVETIMLTHTSLNIGQIEHFFKTLTLLNLISSYMHTNFPIFYNFIVQPYQPLNIGQMSHT